MKNPLAMKKAIISFGFIQWIQKNINKLQAEKSNFWNNTAFVQ